MPILTDLKTVKDKIKSHVKKYLVLLGILLIFFVIFSFTANIFSYFDPINLCYVGIDEDILRGNQKTIRGAIIQLKNNDKESYRVLCQYVNAIKEDYCQSSDPWITKETNEVKSGCYIRGSKIISIIPDKGTGYYIVQQRAATIKKYANYSKTFWETR